MDAIGTGNIKNTKDVTFSAKDLALLKFVKLLTLNPSETKDEDVEALRETGWTDEQIWEMGIEVGIFSFLNRMADAHGLDYPASGWYPPALREKIERAQEAQKGTLPAGSATPPSATTDKKELDKQEPDKKEPDKKETDKKETKP